MMSLYLVSTPEWLRVPVILIFAVGAFRTARLTVALVDRLWERFKNRRGR